MKNDDFDCLVSLMKTIAWYASGDAIHQRRAGSLEEDIKEARAILVDEED